MRKFLMIVAVAACASWAQAGEYYGKAEIGWSALLRPSNAPEGTRTGGFAAAFQGLLGDEPCRYGAELGVSEVYTAWERDGVQLDRSLVLTSLLGVARYEWAGERFTPYLGIGVGPYFALEERNDNADGGVSSSASSHVCGGGSLNAGFQIHLSAKTDLDLSIRYSRIKASDDVALLGFFAGLGWPHMPFISEPKHSTRVRLP